MVDIVRRHIVPAGYAVLPKAMQSDQAASLLLAIGWQESRFEHRKQVKGPARGWWQFEREGGVRGVLTHEKTRDVVRAALKQLGYRQEPTAAGCYEVIEHNDVAAFVFARLLLWTLPGRLPSREESAEGWRQYIAAWRPGKPHHATWSEAWKHGWTA